MRSISHSQETIPIGKYRDEKNMDETRLVLNAYYEGLYNRLGAKRDSLSTETVTLLS